MPTITILTAADVYDAVFDFVKLHALPALDDDHIYRGWQNRSALPYDSQDYAVISWITSTRHGTNTNRFETDLQTRDDGVMRVGELVEVGMQLDFCSTDDRAQSRAQCVETIARDPVGVDFFRFRGVGCLYAENARDMSFVGDDTQYIRRWMTMLHLTYWSQVGVSVPWFDKVNVRLENVDVHHPNK